MKMKILFLFFVFLAALILTGCDSENRGFYVKFTIDGVSYNYDKGYTDLIPEPFASIYDDNFEIMATPDELASDTRPFNWLNFNVAATGTGIFDESGISLNISNNDDGVSLSSTEADMTITRYEPGKVIEGFFTATESGDPDVVLTDGEFRVKTCDACLKR